MENLLENNRVTVVGTLDSDFTVSHELFGEVFCHVSLRVPRLSDICDLLSVTVSERLLREGEFQKGDLVYITGQYRSYNNYSGVGNRLLLTVFARDIRKAEPEEAENTNRITLSGYICKPPVYRTTPFGREIADILLAVNRTYHKSDYIPCIAWGRNARYAKTLQVGDRLQITGRIQSREYQKRLEDDSMVTKTAYEVSVSKLEIAEEE